MSKPKFKKNYQGIAKSLSKVAPNLAKYIKRKKLNQWEKAAITRTANRIAGKGGVGTMRGLTRNEFRRLKSKDAIIGEGVRAIYVQNISPTGKVSVTRDGEIRIKDNRRTFESVSLDLDMSAFLEAASEIYAGHGPRANVFIWTVKGRSKEGFNNIDDLASALAERYFLRYKQIEEWLLGIIWYAEKS